MKLEYKEPVRYKRLNIDESVFSGFFNHCGNYHKYQLFEECSDLWKRVIDNNIKNDVFDYLATQDVHNLKYLYETYYRNGMSDGATSGVAFDRNEKQKKDKTIRNIDRIIPLQNHLEIESTSDLDFYNKIFDRFDIPECINIGEAWGWYYGDNFVHFELADYLYFLDFVTRVLSEYDLNKVMFVGEGSGVLSSLLYRNYNIESAYHVDLGHYLLRQYINDHELEMNITHQYAEQFNSEFKHDYQIMINQDSFPEMTTEALVKYIDNAKSNGVRFILSYNTEINIPVHIRYRDIILSKGYSAVFRHDSTVRPPYVIELFYLQ